MLMLLPGAEEATAEEHVASPAHEAKFSSTAAPPTSKLGASPALQPVHDGGHIGFPSSAREPPAASPFHGAAAGAAPHEARSGMHGQPALPSRAAQLTVPTRQGSPGPQDPLHGQERRGSVKGDSESDAAPSDNEVKMTSIAPSGVCLTLHVPHRNLCRSYSSRSWARLNCAFMNVICLRR